MAIPEWSMISPMKMKRGMGARVKLVREVNICWVARLNPFKPPIKTNAAMKLSKRKLKAMGIPIARRTRSPPMRKRMTSHHSKLTPPSLNI
jgi:hypothetical protein